MNLDDLRAELEAHANEIDPRTPGRLAGIRAKIAQRRRRKAAGTTVAAGVLTVGAIVGVPVVSQLSTGPEPAEGGGGHFPEQIDGDTKITEAVGDFGDKSLTLTFTPEDADFLLDIDCDALAPENPASGRTPSDPFLYVRVNKRLVQPTCGAYGDGAWKGSVGDVTPREQIGIFWNNGKAFAGRPVTIVLRVTGERPVRDFDGRLGVAVYDMTGKRVVSHGSAFTTEKTVAGTTYELGGYASADGGTEATVDVPALGARALVTYGVPQVGLGVRALVQVDGRDDVLHSHGSLQTARLPDGKAHTVTVRGQGGGRAVVAYYVPKAE